MNWIKDHKFVSVFVVSIALSFILYGNTIPGDFVYDDKFFSDRSELKTLDHLSQIWLEPYVGSEVAGAYRPVAIFSFSLNFIIFGSSPVSFHVINIILNGIAVFLLFLLILKLFNNWKLAIFSALFYAVLPIHTEAVAFIKSRDEIIGTIFTLLAWLLFIKSTSDENINWKGVFKSGLLFFIAVLSKEALILSPIIFIIFFYFKRRPSLKKLFEISTIFVPIYLLYFMMRLKALGIYAFGNSGYDFIANPLFQSNVQERLWTPFKIVAIYLEKILIPIKLSATYFYNQVTLVSSPAHSVQALIGIIIFATLIFLVVHKKTRTTPYGVGALIFLVPYFMVSKFIFKAADIVAERWMYFPTTGLSLIAGYLVYKVYDYKKVVGIILMASIVFVYGYMIMTRNRVWLSSESLFGSMVKDAPNSVQGYKMMYFLYMNHRPPEEVAQFIEKAHKIAPQDPAILEEMGVLQFKLGNLNLAEKYFRDAYASDPRQSYMSNLIAFYRLTMVDDEKEGRYDEVIKKLSRLRILEPNNWEIYYLFGQTYVLKNDYSKAKYYYNRALMLNPSNYDIRYRIKMLDNTAVFE
ncbi:MAG: tetratricopeptide repeat protein [bacterium]|nr:tetratricopeptide repeat protein [bacterium]